MFRFMLTHKGWVSDTLLIGVTAILSADLIYLFIAGGWHDPYAAIEITELAVLGILTIASFSRCLMRVMGK